MPSKKDLYRRNKIKQAILESGFEIYNLYPTPGFMQIVLRIRYNLKVGRTTVREMYDELYIVKLNEILWQKQENKE